MIRRGMGCLTVAAGLAWVACGGNEVSPGSDGGSPTGGGGSTGSSTSTTTGSGGGSTSSATTTSGSGGTTGGSAGNGGSGGHPVDAGRDAPGTCAGTVTFQFTAANGKSSDWCVGANCSDVWVTITSSTGTPVTPSILCGVTCDTCTSTPCPPIACRIPQPMKAQGETATWDGTDWQAGTCGANTACRGRQCAAPGHYIAKMCASRSVPDGGPLGQCSTNPMLTCVDVPFDYPTSSVV